MGELKFDSARTPPNFVVTTSGVGGNPLEDRLCGGCPLADGVGVAGAEGDGAGLPLLFGVEFDIGLCCKTLME